jgi:ATP-dependent HslUV protease subunit HslV
MGTTVVKQGASKIRRLLDGRILAGFAGSTADAITLFTRFERKLEEFHGQLERAAVELATDWRTEKTLRQLEALLVVADAKTSLLLSGTGDVIAPDEGVLAVGSGGPYAAAAARALLRHSPLDAAAVVKEALLIAASIDVYTNDAIRVETLP